MNKNKITTQLQLSTKGNMVKKINGYNQHNYIHTFAL